MKQYAGIGKEPNFQIIIITSAVLHLLFITLATIPFKTKEREYRSYFVNLVGPAEVRQPAPAAAPEKTETPKQTPEKTVEKKQEPVKAKAPPRRRVEPKKGVTLEPEKSTERVSREIERLQAIRELAQRKKVQEEAQVRSQEKSEKLADAIEVIRKKKSEGASSGMGIPGTSTSLDSDSYYALVTRQIWSEWIYPEFDTAGLEVIISIKIDKGGRIISQEIEKSSGNVLFDRSAAKAIAKASPLPPPPVDLEIGVRFHL